MRDLLDPAGWFIVLALYLTSDFCLRQYSFFQGDTRRLELSAAFLVCAILPIRFRSGLIYSLMTVAVLGAVIAFLGSCSGRLIFSDDHATFFYRLALLKTNFPSIPFYSPLWNAGIDARDFLPTGAHGVFILFAPLLYLAPLQQLYNIVVVSIVFVLPAILIGSAAWVQSRCLRVAALAALLASAPTLFWYRWGLSYGTLGFLSAVSFAPLALALISKAIEHGSLRHGQAVLMCVAISFCVFWPLAAIVLLPAVLLGLIRARTLLINKTMRLCLLFLLLLHLPWIALFLRCSQVDSFVAGNSVATSAARLDPRVQAAESKKFTPIRTLRTAFAPINPVIGFCLIPAVILAWRRRRRLEVVSCVWLALLAGVVAHWFPQLELERMFIVLALIASSFVADWIISQSKKVNAVLAAVPLAVCALVPATTWRAASNRTPEHYYVQATYVNDLVQRVEAGAAGGRVLVTGFTLHELSHGHLAPLALLSAVPFIANSYVHDQWERGDVIPESFKGRGEAGVVEYLRLYNVSLLLTHDKNWRRWITDRPVLFEALGEIGPFGLFKYREFHNNYFEQGSGEVLRQSDNGVVLRVDTADATIKFRYYPFLKVSGCELRPVEVSTLTLISLHACTPGQEVSISSVSPWRRFWN